MKINTVCFPCGVQPQYLIISFIVCSDCTDLQAVCASHGGHRGEKGASGMVKEKDGIRFENKAEVKEVKTAVITYLAEHSYLSESSRKTLTELYLMLDDMQ